MSQDIQQKRKAENHESDFIRKPKKSKKSHTLACQKQTPATSAQFTLQTAASKKRAKKNRQRAGLKLSPDRDRIMPLPRSELRMSSLPSPFFNLPLEIRQRIYYLHFRSLDLRINFEDLNACIHRTQVKEKKQLPAIMSTSQAVRAECLQPLLQASIIELTGMCKGDIMRYQECIKLHDLRFDFAQNVRCASVTIEPKPKDKTHAWKNKLHATSIIFPAMKGMRRLDIRLYRLERVEYSFLTKTDGLIDQVTGLESLKDIRVEEIVVEARSDTALFKSTKAKGVATRVSSCGRSIRCHVSCWRADRARKVGEEVAGRVGNVLSARALMHVMHDGSKVMT